MEMHTRASLLATHGFDGRVRVRLALGTWLAKLLKRIDDAGRMRRDYETLMAKSDRELSDIGLTRGDIIAGFKHGRWPSHRGHRG
jgi:uncharacterized protein YjiS (DUF1127 family)